MRRRILGIIACQILLIAVSYLILAIFENQSAFLGNTINTSGKNRFFGELLYQETVNYVLSSGQNPTFDTIKSIDNNIKILDHGGPIVKDAVSSSQTQSMVMAVPAKFSEDFARLSSDWRSYKTSVLSEISSKKDSNILKNQDLKDQSMAFVSSADKITSDLSDYSKEQVSNMTMLQVTLLGINVTVHLLLLRIVLKLITGKQTKKILLQQMSSKNKKLEYETRFALIQKDISQAFIVEMENKLQDINERINLIHGKEDYERSNKIVRELFQSLFAKIQQLAQSTIELENKTSKYEQLIKKIQSSISVLSENDNKLSSIKNPEDQVTVILWYVDMVNLMVNEQIIPTKLGRNLTDAMYDIVEHITLKTPRID